jgi:hypothetical protein
MTTRVPAAPDTLMQEPHVPANCALFMAAK